MFYNKLDRLCKEQGTTVTGLLKKLKLSSSKGTSWKNGSIPKGKTLLLIADELNVTVDYLLDNDSLPLQTNKSNDERMLNLLHQLSEDDQIALVNMVQSYVETKLAQNDKSFQQEEA